MIVVISDLHLQHTALDVLRWRDGARTFELRNARNVSAGALSMLVSNVSVNAVRTGARSIELVFAGDIFELIRSPRWLLDGCKLRPTQGPDAELEAMTLRILADIEAECGEFFRALRKAVEGEPLTFRGSEVRLPLPVHVHYLPGNHDRLVNLFPSSRAVVRRLLCMQGRPEDRFPHVYRPGDGYGVLVRHGHEYDPDNFAGRWDEGLPDEADYDRATLGDFVTTDIAMRIPLAFRAHYASELRTPGPAGDAYRELYAALTEFDDIRPATALLAYLVSMLRRDGGDVVKMLRPVLREVFENACADDFFLREARRLGLGMLVARPVAELFDEGIKLLSPSVLARVIEELVKLSSRGASPAIAAACEPAVLGGEVDVVVAGHTHNPAQVAFPAPRPMSDPAAGSTPLPPPDWGVYLDTGTWRTRIDEGVNHSFGRLRAYTMVTCYHRDELRPADADAQERRRFESWSGHLASDTYGPRVFELSSPRAAPMQKVRFTGCSVEHVDEGDTRDGAEIELHFGVDGSGAVFRRSAVHDGDELSVDETVDADPMLDGEVWCWGVEKDLGMSIVDRDDALPWAVDFLARGDGAFRRERRRLHVRNNRGWSLVLSYEVR